MDDPFLASHGSNLSSPRAGRLRGEVSKTQTDMKSALVGKRDDANAQTLFAPNKNKRPDLTGSLPPPLGGSDFSGFSLLWSVVSL